MDNVILLLAAIAFISLQGAIQPNPENPVLDKEERMLEDFEGYPIGGVPTAWQTNKGKNLIPVTPETMNEREKFIVMEEAGNKFVRATIDDEAYRMILTNGNQFEWDVREYPRLRWDWRAIDLPEGAREDKKDKNDTGAAVYVTFSKDWLGRPKSIKYTYSSTLPVGTTASYGPLKVLVVASALEDSTGTWMTLERDVVADYRMLFGKDAPDHPLGLMLWSDSDTVDAIAITDFDNVILLPESPQE